MLPRFYFSSIKKKLFKLTSNHKVRLVYPIAVEKWIVKLPQSKDEAPNRRKSPKRGRVVELFRELVSFPELLNHERFSLEVLMIQEEEIRKHKEGQSWRKRGWVTEERRLLDIVASHQFIDGQDLWNLISSEIAEEFTTTDLVTMINIPRRLAQQMAYCFKKMDVIEQIGKRNRSNLYQRKK